MKNLKHGMATLAMVFSMVTSILGQDPGWPRQIVKPSGTLVAYQPQVDDWQNHQQITLRMAFSLTPTGGKKVIGAAQWGVYQGYLLPFLGSCHIRTDGAVAQ